MDIEERLGNALEEFESAIRYIYSDYISSIECLLKDAKKESMLPLPLYKYVVQTADDLEYVWRARSTDETRWYLHCIHVKDGVAEATNGHILLRAKTKLADGYYDNQSKPVDCDGKFPDTSRVIPDNDNFQDIEVKHECQRYVQLNNDAVFNVEYFNMATEAHHENWRIACDMNDVKCPILLHHKQNTRQAIIMPMRVTMRDGKIVD